MGQIAIPAQVDIFLTDVDRLTASNSAAGMSPNAAHVIALGEDAALNLGDADYIIALGVRAGATLGGAMQDIIAIGRNTLDAGLNSANGNGSIAIGDDALSALTTVNADSPNIAIGQDAAAAMTECYGMVAIGERVMGAAIGSSANRDSFESVLVGAQAGYSTQATFNGFHCYKRTVVIGYQADYRNTDNTSIGSDREDSVIIGYQACMNARQAGANSFNANVVIGASANVGGFATSSVIIGAQASSTTTSSGASGREVIIGNLTTASGLNSQDNVVIGWSAAVNGNRNVVIGSNTESGIANNSVVIGHAALGGNTQAGNYNVVVGAYTFVGTGTASGATRNIIIGYGAGPATTSSDLFIVENTTGTAGGGTIRRMFRGDLNNGNIIIGNVPTADINWRGTTQPTNAVKLVNGTPGLGAAPTNGGFFYVDAGVLHWYDQAGTDFSISVPTAGMMASTTIGYTDGAAAAVGTLNNAPAAGDPTKWIPINDMGTTRYIPAW